MPVSCWIRVRLELPHEGTQCWAEIGVHHLSSTMPWPPAALGASRRDTPTTAEPGAGFTTLKQGKAQEQDAGPAAPVIPDLTPESHTALAQNSDLGQVSWQHPALLRAAKAGANHPNVLSSPSPSGNHPWNLLPLSSPNISPASSKLSTECPGKAPQRGTGALVPSPSPALLSLSHPLLGAQRQERTVLFPGLTSRQLLDPDQHTEQSGAGNALLGKPPLPWERLLSQGAPTPMGSTATTTDLPTAPNQ